MLFKKILNSEQKAGLKMGKKNDILNPETKEASTLHPKLTFKNAW